MCVAISIGTFLYHTLQHENLGLYIVGPPPPQNIKTLIYTVQSNPNVLIFLYFVVGGRPIVPRTL